MMASLDGKEGRDGKDGGKEEASGTRKRVQHPKVRSGCLTCKKRRVKCDERKPLCLRCEKFGVKCDGYLRPVRVHLEPTKTAHRILVPRKRSSTTPPTTPPFEVKKPRFSNEDEMRYFRLFCEKTSYHLSGYNDPNLWTRIVLQASEADDSIRHAVISIGALDMTTAMMRDLENSNAREHHFFALKLYSKAIRGMREVVLRQKEKHDMQTALVASMLIVCFETYHGNYASAAQQIRTGVRLIEDQKSKNDGWAVEEDLIRVFDRLDVQSMSHSDPYSIDEHMVLKNVYAADLENLPPVFLDIKTARDYFNFMSRRVCHFAPIAWKLKHSDSQKSSHSVSDYINKNWLVTMIEELGKFVRLSEAWMESFTPLYMKAREEAKQKSPSKRLSNSSMLALALSNYCLCMRVAFRHFLDANEIAWDKSNAEFREILENVEVLMANQDDYVFSFDLRTVWPLDVVAKKCRVSAMRWRAIQLLKEKPRREGIWDSVVAAMVGEWVINIEEEGMLDDGTVPESSRVRNIGVELDSENRKAKVWCYLPASDGSGDQDLLPRKRQTYLEWGSSRWNGGFVDVMKSGDPYQSGLRKRDEDFIAVEEEKSMSMYFNARPFEGADDTASDISPQVGF
ncbi:uncharacterized protein LY89DRAFT_726283 [Mollisia scopiformis]|uniref:Zn(2)-C6 fungal-type domain-containing protein n=1 Tax=Mollisia scopiformis TaxID=149040 RepID=A0A132B3B0_MOLSC|nr:uncharacterized protein LY89DRAFT_726283 [Mollisia scopiformis]KUJ06882.1 hypothetical protein LY89DRAFT_726283 [Mollisia scopiformis]